MTAREIQPCGTYAAWMRHYRAGEPADDACAEARRVYMQPVQRLARAVEDYFLWLREQGESVEGAAEQLGISLSAAWDLDASCAKELA